METIAEDATWYFLVIFTSHLVLLFTLLLAQVSEAHFSFWTTANHVQRMPPVRNPNSPSFVSHHRTHPGYDGPHPSPRHDKRKRRVSPMFASPALSYKRPTTGFRYPSVMISRMILSLRMAADSRQGVRSHGGPTAKGTDLTELKFVRPRRSGDERESDISLDVYPRP